MSFWFTPSELHWDEQLECWCRGFAYLEGRLERGDRLKCLGNAVRYPMWDTDVKTLALVRARLLACLA